MLNLLKKYDLVDSNVVVMLISKIVDLNKTALEGINDMTSLESDFKREREVFS